MAWRQMSRGFTTQMQWAQHGTWWPYLQIVSLQTRGPLPLHLALPLLCFPLSRVTVRHSHPHQITNPGCCAGAWLFCRHHAQMWMDQGPCNTNLHCELFRPTPHISKLIATPDRPHIAKTGILPGKRGNKERRRRSNRLNKEEENSAHLHMLPPGIMWLHS